MMEFLHLKELNLTFLSALKSLLKSVIARIFKFILASHKKK